MADDPLGCAVLDRAEIDLAFEGSMLGDVDQQFDVDGLRSEVPLHAVIMSSRASLLTQGETFDDGSSNPLLRH